MELSESGRANALAFLEKFVSTSKPPSSEEALPVALPTWWTKEEEVEGVCLDMARGYLASMRCPGILSYHIAAESYRRLAAAGPPGRWTLEPGAEEGENAAPTSQVPRVDVSALAGALLGSVRQVCTDWAGALPPLSCPQHPTELSLFAMKNTRRKMEDRHALCVDINSLFGFKDCPPQSFYGVFDGHITADAASYAAIHVLPNLVRHPAFLDDPTTALKEAVRTTDKNFCEKGLKSGCTAVFSLLRGRELHTGWVGDSQAFLFRRGVPVSLVDPHKPEREDEQERIEAAGGLVIWMGSWRVNGNLSVSRAIGDAAEKSLIVGEADVMSEVLGGSEDYLLLACDGVWDVLNGDEVAESVYKHLSRGGTKQGVAKAIVDFARSEGSGDNITAIVLFFPTFQLVAPPTLEAPPTVAAPPTAAVEAESQDKSTVSEQPL